VALLARVIQTRRQRRADDAPSAQPGASVNARLAALEQQVARLELLLEQLQDSVHRDSVRTREGLRELETKTEPAELARALSRDARERGL
jgi:hypothetical protein